MKADNVTSLDKEREASEASKLAQGYFLGPPFSGTVSSILSHRSQAKCAVNGFAVAVRSLKLLR